MTTDLNTLLTALHVKIDDWLGEYTRTGRPPKLSDAELLTVAVAQALLGIRSEARWLRPSYRNRTPRPGEHLLKPIRQLIESVFDTLTGQLDLELHGGRTTNGVGVRVGQRLLAC